MKILVVASGGDAPGTNMFIAKLYAKYGNSLYACRGGFRGLCNGDIVPARFFEPHKYAFKAGCCIGAGRFEQFKEPEHFQKALENAKQFDKLVVLGGNGSQKGVRELADNGVKAVFVPTTIDCDVKCSDYSIGFHTAVKAVCDSVKNIMPSMQAHSRAVIIETMGRRCGKIAEVSGKILGADMIISDEKALNEPALASLITSKFQKGEPTLVVMREHICSAEELVSRLSKQVAPAEVKSFVVGHLQRGTQPTDAELKLAKRFAHGAIKALENNALPCAVVLQDGAIKLQKL